MPLAGSSWGVRQSGYLLAPTAPVAGTRDLGRDLADLLGTLDGQGRLEWERAHLDATFVPAKKEETR